MARPAKMKIAVLCVLSAALAGCASHTLSIRSVPAEHPAADNEAAAQNAAAFAAAAANATDKSGQAAAAAQPLPIEPQDAPSMVTYDPWERLNRLVYRFNARFDEALFLPAANAYRRVPSPVRAGVHNFFDNLTEIDSMVNYALQGRIGYGVRSAGRFAINSTLGIGGLFDVAKKLNLPPAQTGFGTTLAKWGMHPGPYLVLPLLGPSTLRDGVGFLGDFGTSYAINIANLYRGNASWGLDAANGVDERANISFRYYASGSPFEYETIRFLYVRKRLIEDEGLHSKMHGQGEKATEPENAQQAPAGK